MFLDDEFHFFWIEMISVVLDQVLDPAVEVQDAVVSVVAEIAGPRESIFSPVLLFNEITRVF
jgi:hypothetical protein